MKAVQGEILEALTLSRNPTAAVLFWGGFLWMLSCGDAPARPQIGPLPEKPNQVRVCRRIGTDKVVNDFYRRRRLVMVREQIEARGVRDPSVLDAMLVVPRHKFAPAEFIDDAYADRPLPIGEGQTISQPYMVAFMCELLELEEAHTVLEIGTGCGYHAAVLSLLAQQVFSIEIVESLGRSAQQRLENLGYDNVVVSVGNGYLGLPDKAPFDRIILTAAPTELPPTLIDQLKPGGRLVAPIGPVNGHQELVLVTKDPTGKVHQRSVLPVRFVPMVRTP
jgi:protein-L-isoaspartate(D-aspartate) O-methyltransferase